MRAVVLWTSMPDKASAQKLARALVTKKLAACVSVVPGVVSTYRWKGRVETSREALVIVKTTQARYNAVQKFVLNHHPYELPELLALPVVKGSKKYLSWIQQSSGL